jgi:acetyltransferase-like isoleucine patch superfamily enzyme
VENIQSEFIEIGTQSFVHPTAIIRGLKGKAKRIVIGDHVYIGEQVQIICDDFQIGDYSKIQHRTTIHGYQPCHIGHNAWIGQHCILDSIGGMKIGNNCGIGAHSQLWSHIKFGDTLEGSNFHSTKEMNIGNDVWFVGHCIVSPINADDKSMALAGSVITHDMAYNHLYGGSPAKDLTEQLGTPYSEVSLEEKVERMVAYVEDLNVSEDIVIVRYASEIDFTDGKTYFVVNDRRYTKRGTPAEVAFMKYLLPEKAKFVPYDIH